MWIVFFIAVGILVLLFFPIRVRFNIVLDLLKLDGTLKAKVFFVPVFKLSVKLDNIIDSEITCENLMPNIVLMLNGKKQIKIAFSEQPIQKIDRRYLDIIKKIIIYSYRFGIETKLNLGVKNNAFAAMMFGLSYPLVMSLIAGIILRFKPKTRIVNESEKTARQDEMILESRVKLTTCIVFVLYSLWRQSDNKKRERINRSNTKETSN
ncbi:MAG: hypothetical protein FWD89_05155 [Firmicutes bacterium]|nr:hypothetical protein [Bacillota bacterium]MCL2771671.1 hypothetical protein [Bacillota bacterium]